MTSQFRTAAQINISAADLRAWAESHETHEAVALAIHAIADGARSAQVIWEDPKPAEWEHVTMAVQNYVESGEFPAEADGRYSWGLEAIELSAEGA